MRERQRAGPQEPDRGPHAPAARPTSFYIATELLDGQTLRDFIDGKKREGRDGLVQAAPATCITHVANGLERAAGSMPHGGLNPTADLGEQGMAAVKVGRPRPRRTAARRWPAAGAPTAPPTPVVRRPRGAGRGAAELGLGRLFARGPPLRGGDRAGCLRLLQAGDPGAAADVPPIADAILAKALAPGSPPGSPPRWTCATRCRPGDGRRGPEPRPGGQAPSRSPVLPCPGGCEGPPYSKRRWNLAPHRRRGARSAVPSTWPRSAEVSIDEARSVAHREGPPRLRALPLTQVRRRSARRDHRRTHDRRQRHRRPQEGEGLPGAERAHQDLRGTASRTVEPPPR